MDQEEQDKQNKRVIDLSSISPVVKRRSSLFSRRISRGIAVRKAENGNSSRENAEDKITLKEYFDKLNNEENDWKALKLARQNRKQASRDAIARGPPSLKWEDSQDLLTDDDKQFIAKIPDCRATLQKLEEAEQHLGLYEHYGLRLAQTATCLIDRLEGYTVAEGTGSNIFGGPELQHCERNCAGDNVVEKNDAADNVVKETIE
ncbi:uncharacterized protein LOC134528322 isoform X2 [Bacillus rossius redtenbacheri]|uniref:uncharacterized protein LOC134528322 isoform X2 n=1 Tax=Bacillus rossius redtenbacheri TaxID=93214 RepID=UPI002FDE5BDE